MPSGPKKRRAKRKKELEKNLALDSVEKSQVLKPKTDVESAEDALSEVKFKGTQENPDENRTDENLKTKTDDESENAAASGLNQMLLSRKSAISDDELNQMIPLALTINVQINRVKKMVEEIKKIAEEALVTIDKLEVTMKKLLNDLEAVKNSSDIKCSSP